MKNYYLALMVSALLTLNIYAEVEEVVVTSALTSQNASDLKDPLHIVDGRLQCEVDLSDHLHSEM